MANRLPTISDQSYNGGHRQATRRLLIETVAHTTEYRSRRGVSNLAAADRESTSSSRATGMPDYRVGRPRTVAPNGVTEAERPMPDFDAATNGRATRRSRPRMWLAAGATVLIMGGGAAALYLPWSRSTTVGGSSTPRTTAAPTIVAVMIAPTSVSPRQLMLITMDPSATPGICSPLTFSVKESATEVRVRLSFPHTPTGARIVGPASAAPVVRVGPSAGTKGAAEHVPCAHPNPGAIVGQIPHPLGRRSIIDDATGRRIPLFEPKPLIPTHVPTGYHAADGYTPGWRDMDPMESATLDYRPGALAPLGALGSFYTNSAGVQLTVVTAPSDAVNAGAQNVGHASVDGHDATVTETDQTRCVTWTASPQSGRQVCSDIKEANTASAADLLSEAELLQVARSLR